MEKEEERANKTHVLVIPLPFQGHINPMLQFAKRLAAKGSRVTFIVPFSCPETNGIDLGPIRFKPVSPGPPGQDGKLEKMLEWFREAVPKRLPEITAVEEAEGWPVGCVVYDSGAPWILGLAHGLGLPGASFFTHSCAVACVYYSVGAGLLKIPVEREAQISLPGLPVLEQKDLPSFVADPGSYPSMLELVISRFSNIGEVDWIFFSSFDGLEKEAFKRMRTRWPVKPIGPTIPSMYLDKRLEHDTDYGYNNVTTTKSLCIEWLDSKPTNSVVYVSFGSLANLSSAQLTELAEGLRQSQCHVLWAIRDSEASKLLIEESPENFLILNWVPQLEVLAHKSVGCFVTHCGWNSTMEAIGLGVPMVAVPQWTDQRTNAKFLAEVWNVGMRAEPGEDGIVNRDEIERCVENVMREEKGREMRENGVKFRELAVEALSIGGSSDKNIDEFLVELVGLKRQKSLN